MIRLSNFITFQVYGLKIDHYAQSLMIIPGKIVTYIENYIDLTAFTVCSEF